MKIFNTAFVNSKDKDEQKRLKAEIMASPMFRNLLVEILESRLASIEGTMDNTESQFKLAKCLGSRKEVKYLISLFKESDNDR